jgi:predicted DNA-binding transcriptional regulator AlpA
MRVSGKYSKEACKRLLQASGVCARYGRSSRTIDRWVAEGVIPQPRYIRGLRYWIEEELDRCDEARSHEQTVVRGFARQADAFEPIGVTANRIVEKLRP